MKRVRLLRWSSSVLSPRTRPQRCPHAPSPFSPFRRCQATAAAPFEPSDSLEGSSSDGAPSPNPNPNPVPVRKDIDYPSPPIAKAKTSPKLAALHARLQLPSRLPIETLARTLVDPSADDSLHFNNKAFTALGADLLGFYTSEYIIAQYPRLPLSVVYAAMYAYVGPAALAAIAREWGIEAAAEPGGEVDPGLLQFKHAPPPQQTLQVPQAPQLDENLIRTRVPRMEGNKEKRGLSTRSMRDDEFGEPVSNPWKTPAPSPDEVGITLEKASMNFVRALVGAVYMHSGRAATKQFYREHFMSRQLDVSSLFRIQKPERDLSRLCAREGFLAPVAKILSETGRKSKIPVFVVGIYSGNDKLGEGVGGSLAEARTRASVAALKGWYLYSPIEFRLPSETEEPGAKVWSPILVDQGDVY